MAAKHKMPEMKEGGVNVTPLIDIVMCLIIFFMLVARIGVAGGGDEKIVPPETILGVQIKDLGNSLTLNVRSQPGDEPLVTALLNQQDTKPKEIKLLEIAGGKRDEPLLRALKASKKANKNFKIVVLADQDVPYYQLEQVLITCAKAEVTDINFKTRQMTGVAAPTPPAE